MKCSVWVKIPLIAVFVFCSSGLFVRAEDPLTFEVKLETVIKHDDGQFLWFHPRAVAASSGNGARPKMVMSLQRHLMVSDYYSGLYLMERSDPERAWTGPVLHAGLDWRKETDGTTISVADVTPGFHPQTGKVILIGAQVRYSPAGKQLDDVKRAHRTVYSVGDLTSGKWTPWRILEFPADEQFDFARNACSQWLVEPDGSLKVPLYISPSVKEKFSTTVAECHFDGDELTYVKNGNVLRLAVARGLYEPSLIGFQGRYFLTLRNDEAGYVSVSDDGLEFSEPVRWTFDDGGDLGSYNTQQHWLAHSDGLFLIYTRRGANNDHIARNRAPLFMAQVDPETLKVIRSTEKVVVPERGAQLGNFGANAVDASESWITVSEGMFRKDARERGAEGATFVAKILWSKPNRLLEK
jgi:hypothetical protein